MTAEAPNKNTEAPKVRDETPKIKLIAFDQDDTALLPNGKPSPRDWKPSKPHSTGIGRELGERPQHRPQLRTLQRCAAAVRPALRHRQQWRDHTRAGSAGAKALLFEKRIQQDVFLDLLDFIEENGFNFVYSWLRVTENGPWTV